MRRVATHSRRTRRCCRLSSLRRESASTRSVRHQSCVGAGGNRADPAGHRQRVSNGGARGSGQSNHHHAASRGARVVARDVQLVAALVFVTVVVVPATQIVAMLYVLLPMQFGVVPPFVEFPLRLFQVVKPWGMVEVFILGILVSLLSSRTWRMWSPASRCGRLPCWWWCSPRSVMRSIRFASGRASSVSRERGERRLHRLPRMRSVVPDSGSRHGARIALAAPRRCTSASRTVWRARGRC